MHGLKKRLHTPNGLVTFEAPARHLSFTRAAAELFVSQAAVSRQIRRLGDRIGRELFERQHRRLTLTEPGNRLNDAVTFGFGHIAEAIDGIVETRHDQIHVATTVAFASCWLAPRPSGFRAAHPHPMSGYWHSTETRISLPTPSTWPSSAAGATFPGGA